MNALVLEEVGKLVYKSVDLADIGTGNVLVKIAACGICSSDFNRCLRTGAHRLPIIPGHEISGTILKVSKDVDSSIIGKKCVIFPLIPCFKCEYCQRNQFNLCRDYNYVGSRRDGGFAEYIIVPVWNILTIADAIDLNVAALCEPCAVALHGVRKLNLTEDSKIGIIGTGTIGIITALWLKHLAVKSVCISRTECKDRFLSSLGLETCRSGQDDLFCTATIDCVGTDYSFISSVRNTKPEGKIVLIGNPDTDRIMPKHDYWKLLRNEIMVMGSWNSSYGLQNNDWSLSIKFLEQNQDILKKLITHQFKLSYGIKAFEDMELKKSLSIKGIFVPDA